MSEADEAFNEGYHIYQTHGPGGKDKNPYNPDSPNFKEWLVGFQSAEIDEHDETETEQVIADQDVDFDDDDDGDILH